MRSRRYVLAVAAVCMLSSHGLADSPGEQWKQIVVQSLTIVETMRSQLESADKEMRARAEKLYTLGWAIGIEASKGHEKEIVTSEFMKGWGDEWKKGKNIVLLSRAFAEGGADRSYLLPEVMAAWGRSTETPVLKTMAYWFSRFGSDEEAAFLEARIEKLVDPDQQQILQNGLNWRNYWKDNSNGMPSASEPSPG